MVVAVAAVANGQVVVLKIVNGGVVIALLEQVVRETSHDRAVAVGPKAATEDCIFHGF